MILHRFLAFSRQRRRATNHAIQIQKMEVAFRISKFETFFQIFFHPALRMSDEIKDKFDEEIRLKFLDSLLNLIEERLIGTFDI